MEKVKTFLAEKKHRPFILVSLIGALIGGIFAFRKHVPAIGAALRTKYFLGVGIFSGMGALLFMIFRAIRFLVRLYP